MTSTPSPREIPFNYTSADDRQAISHLLGPEVWRKLEELRSRRVTGRSARLLMRFFGELLIHRRNPFLFQELLDTPARRRRLARHLAADLAVVEQGAGGDGLVRDVLSSARKLVADLEREVAGAPGERQRILSALGPVVGRANVLFDPFTLVSHATDATDWRLHLPVAVAMPTEESQVAPLLAAVAGLGLSAIPRGAGTGLCGGVTPVAGGIMLAFARMKKILSIDYENRTALVEAGVVNLDLSTAIARDGYFYAPDPGSQAASTIGGNVAHALPAADGTISLLALDAWAEVANKHGRRTVPLQALFSEASKPIWDGPDTVLVGDTLPIHEILLGLAIALAYSLVPILILIGLLYWVDRYQKEPLRMLVLALKCQN